ncbi:MAG: methylated-DNA--[protein]-cysteine S-methyltransferase [Phycisphaerae bacterium]
MRTLPPYSEMVRAAMRRDRDYDGVFFIAVRTTGVFCRLGCPARLPRPENVEFFPTPDAAQRAGYRACRRCRPLEPSDATPEWIAPLLQRLGSAGGAPLRDRDLRARGIDPARARRFFRRRYGTTFLAYARGRRIGRALDQLKKGSRMIQAALDAGYQSPSGFSAAVSRLVGRRPARHAVALATQLLDSPLGPLLAAFRENRLAALEFVAGRVMKTFLAELGARFDAAVVPGTGPHFDRLRIQMGEYFTGQRTRFNLTLAETGTPFQRRVWNALCEIPYGQTRSYRDIARRVGSPAAVRAVGQANGRNPIAIVVPCHRVVNADGSLGGYGGEPWRKRFLLDLEQSTLNATRA